MKKVLLTSVAFIAIVASSSAHAESAQCAQMAALVKQNHELAEKLNKLSKDNSTLCTPDFFSLAERLYNIQVQIGAISSTKPGECRDTRPGAAAETAATTAGQKAFCAGKSREKAEQEVLIERGRKSLAEWRKKVDGQSTSPTTQHSSKEDPNMTGPDLNCLTERGTLDIVDHNCKPGTPQAGKPPNNNPKNVPTPQYDHHGGIPPKDSTRASQPAREARVAPTPDYRNALVLRPAYTPPSPTDPEKEDLRAPDTTATGHRDGGRWIAPSAEDTNIMRWCEHTNDPAKKAVIGLAYWYDMCVSDGDAEKLRWNLNEADDSNDKPPRDPGRPANECGEGSGLKPDPTGFGRWTCQKLGGDLPLEGRSKAENRLRASAENKLRMANDKIVSTRTAKGRELTVALEAAEGFFRDAAEDFSAIGDEENHDAALREAGRMAAMKFLETYDGKKPSVNACRAAAQNFVLDERNPQSTKLLKKIEGLCGQNGIPPKEATPRQQTGASSPPPVREAKKTEDENEADSEPKKVPVAVPETKRVPTAADLNAPFPKLQPGQKLCMDAIPPGDPFYDACHKCENIPLSQWDKVCGKTEWLVSDRMKRSPYFKAWLKKTPKGGGG
jgi:hypothetical protein